MWLRVFQASGLAFLFIPINTISYTGVARSENNDVSGLTNLARNIGGSTGTAFVATMLSRRSQAHEAYMIRDLTPGSPGFDNQVRGLMGSFHGGAPGAGGTFGGNASHVSGIHAAQGFIYNQLHRQSAMLAYMDIISSLAVFCFLMIPLVLLIGKIKPPADGPAVH
jgi:DHA2 family multidrug resistance protein